MRIKSPLPPLVFYFKVTDNLLDCIAAIAAYNCNYSVYRLHNKKGYCILLYTGLAQRKKLLIKMCEFGNFQGSNQLFHAFLEEHGEIVGIKNGLKTQSLPLD